MQDMVATLKLFWERITSITDLPKAVTGTDFVEIAIITILLYYILVWVRYTRAWTLLKGILVILIFVAIAAVFQMSTIIWIAEKTFSVAIIAVIVVFQPEMRNALENLGRKRIFGRTFFDSSKNAGKKFSDNTITELVTACYAMGKVKTGALIVIENDITLRKYEESGIKIDGILTSQLLINIFEKNTPLHDGAVLVHGNRVAFATCYLPLTDSLTLSKDLGTRHRAAVGISEVSDSLTIVVSEETGKVSYTFNGRLERNVDAGKLTKKLKEIQGKEQDISKFKLLKRRLKGVKKDGEEADK